MSRVVNLPQSVTSPELSLYLTMCLEHSHISACVPCIRWQVLSKYNLPTKLQKNVRISMSSLRCE